MLKELIPKDKHDLESVHKAIKEGYPAVQPILPQLLEWIQDYNWPVAQELAPFLASIGLPLEIELRKILEGNDEEWKYWILFEIIQKSPPLITNMRNNLLRLAETPSESERLNNLHLIAFDILGKQN